MYVCVCVCVCVCELIHPQIESHPVAEVGPASSVASSTGSQSSAITTTGGRVASTVRLLAHLDTVQTRMQHSYRALSELQQWQSRVAAIERTFESRDFVQVISLVVVAVALSLCYCCSC
jgi:hypothetical protein